MKSMQNLICALAVVSAGLSPAAASDAAEDAAASSAGPIQVYVEYGGSVYFLRVADITVSAAINPDSYAAAATFRSAGLLRWFDDTDIEATATGYRRPDGFAPLRYEHVNHASNKGRVVGIDFQDGVALPDVQPPFGSMGEPPASDAERAGAIDPISTILSLMTRSFSQDAAVCEGRAPVFDGKARYDLVFRNAGRERVRTEAWRGYAIECQAYLEPISGYDPGDRPSEAETERPVTIWLAPIGDIHVPVRFRARTQIGGVTIQASRVFVETAEGG